MSKPIDMTGQQFDTSTIIRLATLEEVKKANLKGRSAFWVLKCNLCGKEFIRSRQVLMRGQTKCECQRTNLPVDLTGEKFGRLTVVRMATLEERKAHGNSKRTFCWCKCDCGNPELIYIKANQLLTGNTKSCGCLRSEKIINYNLENKAKDLSGQKFGKLTVLRLATFEERKQLDKKQERSYFWCQCDCGSAPKLICGNELVKGKTKSCGCIKSFGEEQIVKILNKNNIQYSREQTFNDLIGSNGGLLRYDFCIYNKNQIVGLIECDGELHREETEYSDLEITQLHDKVKDEYAKNKSFPLLRIEYYNKRIIEEDEIMIEVRRWLQ